GNDKIHAEIATHILHECIRNFPGFNVQKTITDIDEMIANDQYTQFEKIQHIANEMRSLRKNALKKPINTPGRKNFLIHTAAYFNIQKPNLILTNHLIKKFNGYVQRSEWFRIYTNKALTAKKKKLARLTIDVFKNLIKLGLGNDTKTIHQILQIA